MLGGAGQKLQTMVELAEDLYERVTELRSRLEAVSGTVDDTAERVERLEAALAEQRALVEALADERGIDVESIVESVAESGEATGPDEGAVTDGESGTE